MATEATEKMTTIAVEMTEQQALAFAQFLKRAGYSDYRSNAPSAADAYQMQYAASQIQNALAGAGFSPR